MYQKIILSLTLVIIFTGTSYVSAMENNVSPSTNKNNELMCSESFDSESLRNVLRHSLNDLNLSSKSGRLKESLINWGMKHSEIAELTKKEVPIVMTQHAAQRIAERNLSPESVSNVVANGKKECAGEYQPDANTIKYVDGNTTVITNALSKKVITAYSEKNNTSEARNELDELDCEEISTHPVYLRKKVEKQGFRGKDFLRQLRKISRKEASRQRKKRIEPKDNLYSETGNI